MADSQATLAPLAVAALRDEAATDGAARGQMERSISMDIREEREDLKKAAEQSLNAIIELDLEGRVRWVSPSWLDLTGTAAKTLIGMAISDVVVEDQAVFAERVEAMRKDDSKSYIIRFSVRAPMVPEVKVLTIADPVVAGESASPQAERSEGDALQPLQRQETIDLEAQGIMVYDRTSGEESHTMWMVKPAISREITIDLPDVLVESLGIGAEMLADYLTLLADVGVQDPGNHPPPLPVLCRICERHITPWWFEKHTELCSQEHRAEMEVSLAQESLNEQRSAIVKVLDALEAQARPPKPMPDAGSPVPAPKAEYKGLSIGSTSSHSSPHSSGRASPAAPTIPRSRDSSANGLSHHRARSFAVRRPLARIVELVLDLCDTAMEINTPSIKNTKSYAPGELRTQSPQSESRTQQVLQWQSPGTGSFENEQGLALLCDETAQLSRAKVEAVFRHRRVLEYSERIRIEYDILVQECIEAALQKTARVQAGDLSDDSEESSKYQTPEQQMEMDEFDAAQTFVRPSYSEDDHSAISQSLSHSPSSMAMALRNASDAARTHRTSSAGSSRASSPKGGTTTPKSYAGSSEPFPFHKRASIAFESDAGGDSDSSVRSSVASSNQRRTESPHPDVPLARMASTRSRDRKRQSLVLPSLAARNNSPGRAPPPPLSPLRMVKPRLPSGMMDSLPSPIISPVLSASEFTSPIIRPQHLNHHRRQSSNVLADMLGRPSSPRLSAVASNPQPRAVQTSIKDFEIIKPISKGAFGSVYLSKKKSTGDYFAIKVLKKADMVAKNQVTNVKAERAIMMWQGESDYVAKLYWTFSSKEYLYLVMEYLNGGDCASLIKVLGALPEDWTMKYIAEVVLCVQHLHSRQIVHRDLKPDNLLIDAKGHLKLTDFGLSRMGLIGRQKRAINAKSDDAPPDLLKAGPFRRAPSMGSSRSASFDYQGNSHSPAQTPAMTPAYNSDLAQPSYFNLNRESSREPSRRASGHRSNSGDSEALDALFRRFSIVGESRTPIEEETGSEEGSESPDPYGLHTIASNTSSLPRTDTPPQPSSMLPPIMALFDPEDSNRRFVGTPDYLAPETINGAGQDEMSDWWSLGCILFECLYGRPPFNADHPEQVFQNILQRNIHWPTDEDEAMVSEEAKDLMNKLMCADPKTRLGANKDERWASGGDEIKAHPWFADINWETLREEEASFIPASENIEDTEYFDARGATMQEFQDELSSPALTPGADYPDRPYDALSRVRSQVNAVKRNLMPLHIPPHVRDARSRRLSEPVVADDFGNFQFKNLPVLEKANKDVIQKLRADAMHGQTKQMSMTGNLSPAIISPTPVPSLDSSPILPMPLKRTLSANKGHNRPQSPSLLGQQSTPSQVSSSPNRGSQPSSPLLVSFSAGGNHERRKTSSGSSGLSAPPRNPTLAPGSFFEQMPRLPVLFRAPSAGPSPIKSAKSTALQSPLAGDRAAEHPRQSGTSSPRQRSHTVGSQEGDLVPELVPAHYKRRSGVFDVSPSSSDTEETRQKALLRVQRRRQSSRRMSAISLGDGPSFRTLDVLVCEDHPVSRLVMERLLEKLRCRTIAVTNGSEAMRYAMSEVKFDIIMMEYKLPQVDGANVARMIRETKNANDHTPIVAVTGYLKELQAPHHFDALVEKPPNKEKLEAVMGLLCQWKAAPEGWKPTLSQPIPRSNLHKEESMRDDSPSTTASTSSGFHGFGRALASSSYSGSTRQHSLGSNSTNDTDSLTRYDSIPVIISRQPTMDSEQSEMNFGGLGISQSMSVSPEPDVKFSLHEPLQLSHVLTAPAQLEAPEDANALRRQPSVEEIYAKRRSIDKNRHENAGSESGDDEDDELGNVNTRPRSPKRTAGKRTSKLGTEMMRTNSQGSVISVDEIVYHPSAPKEGASTVHAIMEDSAAEVEASGRLTPPELFSKQLAGHHTETIVMEAIPGDPDATPKSQQMAGQEFDPDPTPRASTSPCQQDALD